MLKLPASLVSAGKPVKLAVRPKPGTNAWVMVHGYRDPFAATQIAMIPQPIMPAIAAFTPHAQGKAGVTIAQYDIPLDPLP